LIFELTIGIVIAWDSLKKATQNLEKMK
jgi:hypothetical protein